MTAFRIHLSDESLRADDVDVRRVAKKLSTLVKELTRANHSEHDTWPNDKWLIKATQLLGGESLHAAQAEAKNQKDYLRRLPPAERQAEERRAQRRAYLRDPMLNSRAEAYLDALFTPKFCKQFPARWRDNALNVLLFDHRLGLRNADVGRADVVVGVGNVEVVTAATTARGEYGILIDLAQDGALAKLAAWQHTDRGMAATTVGFLGMSSVIARGNATHLLSHITQFVQTDRRVIAAFALDNETDLPVLLEPTDGHLHFDKVSVHYLDKLYDELQWSKHFDVPMNQSVS